MSTRERSTSTASEGAAAPPPPAPPGRFQLKEAKEALAASRKREADLKRANEELRAKVESFHGLRALTEATEETNANLRAEAQDQARRCREDREALDITKGALEKARADCARTIADLATAHSQLREAERLKKDAEAQTRRALDEAARSAQKQQDTAARLSHVGRERDLAAEALRVSERDQASSEETIESLSAKLQDAEARQSGRSGALSTPLATKIPLILLASQRSLPHQSCTAIAADTISLLYTSMAAITAASDASDASYELLVTPEELKGGLVVDYNYEAYARKALEGDADDIERAWASKLETHPKTYDGFKFRLHAVVKSDDKVTLQVGLTGYREFVGTQTNPRLRAAGSAHLSNALGCECVLTTSDNKIVLLRRSTDVAFASGLYNGPSGHAEPQYVWNKNISREVLRDGIIREIVEEVGIPEKALSEPRLIGVMRDADQKPDCLFVLETTQTSSEVKEGYRHALEAWESERLAFVDSEDCGLALTPVTRAAFACLARDRAL